MLHANLLSALDFPTASGVSNTSFKRTQGKALKCLLNVSLSSFQHSILLVNVTENIMPRIQDVDMVPASPFTSKSLQSFLLSRTKVTAISIKYSPAVILTGSEMQVLDF